MKMVDQLVKRPSRLTAELNAFLVMEPAKALSDVGSYRSGRSDHLISETELLFRRKFLNKIENILILFPHSVSKHLNPQRFQFAAAYLSSNVRVNA